MTFTDEFEQIKADARRWAERERRRMQAFYLAVNYQAAEFQKLQRELQADKNEERNGDWTR